MIVDSLVIVFLYTASLVLFLCNAVGIGYLLTQDYTPRRTKYTLYITVSVMFVCTTALVVHTKDSTSLVLHGLSWYYIGMLVTERLKSAGQKSPTDSRKSEVVAEHKNYDPDLEEEGEPKPLGDLLTKVDKYRHLH